MASVNKVIILGNLGRDPEIKYMPSGDAVASLAIATSDQWKDKTTGEKKEHTEWHRVSFFGRTAEVCDQYLKKGSQVYIEGSLRTRKYMDKDGVEKYATEIRGDSMRMIGSRSEGGGQAESPPARQSGGTGPATPRNQAQQSAPRPQQKPAASYDDQDIPF